MATKQELFTKVTGLTYDVEDIKDEELLTWLIPDGAMLDDPEGEKAKDTAEFMAAAGLDKSTKFDDEDTDNDSSSYDDEDDSDDESSDLDDPKSTVEVNP